MIRNEIDDRLYFEAEIENIERDQWAISGVEGASRQAAGSRSEKAFEILHPSAYERRRVLKEFVANVSCLDADFRGLRRCAEIGTKTAFCSVGRCR